MRSFPYLVVLLVAIAASSVLAQSAGQITIWVNGATPAPQRLRFVDPPGRILPAVKNCAPQYGGNNRSNDWATAAYLLQALAASQQNGCGQGFGFAQPSYGYGQNLGYGNGFNTGDLELSQNTRDRAILSAQADVLQARQALNEAIAAPLGNCRTQIDVALARNRHDRNVLSAQADLIRAQQELRRVQSGY